MSLVIGDNFQFLGSKPLDSRLTFSTLADMVAMADSTLYNGIIAYCVGEDKNYQWKSTNPMDPTTGKWREFTTGGGGASDLVDLGDVNIEDPADGEVLKYDAAEEKWVNGEVAGGSGRAKSTAIAPEFDDTATYAAGDRVMYEDELYVFNKPHTGAWAAADADKTDVDSEIPDTMSAADVQDVKDAFAGMNQGAPLRMMHYSTDEQVIGTWIDGKPIYQKTINIGSLPKSTEKLVPHGISNLEHLIDLRGIAEGTASSTILRQNVILTSPNDNSYAISTFISNSNIVIQTKSDKSFMSGYVTMQYTKTTD